MGPWYARVQLFDPNTEELFPVHEGIAVSVARRDPETGRVDLERIPFAWDERARCFVADPGDARIGREHWCCVTFEARNFSKQKQRLLTLEEAQAATERVWAPARFPQWDSGWDDAYARNEFLKVLSGGAPSSPEHPIELKVPIRRLYVVGHRGAPYAYPENTLASHRRALDLGANGLEFDLCMLADGRIAVFHDAQPVKQPPRVDRTLFEKLPFELISPRFNVTGRTATLYGVDGGHVVREREVRLGRRNELDLVRLSFDEAREAYRYAPVEGTEHRIIDFDAFLRFASEESDRLRFLFFDVKPPGKLGDPKPAAEFGRRIGTALRQLERLPERLVIGYADAKVLVRLRRAIEKTGEDRCWYAFDAAGGFAPWIRGVARGWAFLPGFLRRGLARILPGVPNPLKVARRLKNRVVSIGTLARPAYLDEIRQAVRDRDYRPHSTVEMVVHWTLNDREAFAHSIESGVNAVLTDKPDDLLAFLAERGVHVN